ncbi:MAG: exodeoxyribonuclease VII large subunit [Bacteroidota bacterium]
MQSYSLYELHEHLRRAIALNFPTAVWINCEISAHNVSRGHHFLSLLEKGEGEREILAQADAVIWLGQYRKLRKQLGKEVDQLLQNGRQIRVKAKVDFHERFGLKLIVEDLDLAYTIGQLELQRRAIIERLQAENLIGKNQERVLPKVLQSIAVLSSEQAAGWKDFEAQLKENSFRYRFDLQLFSTALQGTAVRGEILKQLSKVGRNQQAFDAVVLIRGGGARLDLSAFDDYKIGAAIANFPLPVLTGIGHEIDESILDLVTHTALKTPTAVADFIVQHNLQFESQILQHFNHLQNTTQAAIQQQIFHLKRLSEQLTLSAKNQLSNQNQHLQQLNNQLPHLAQNQLRQQRQKIKHLEQLSHFLSLQNTLSRGFTLTMKDGKVITSKHGLKKGEVLRTRFEDGEIDSQVL